jgi:hypothetical protein
MNDIALAPLLHALGVAAFERREDGSFTAVTEPPAWFAGLASDGTFPFLGHVLEEAVAFWNTGRTGSRDFGPCAEVDDRGREFHFTVTACSGARQYLIFRLDAGSDAMQAVLQRVRDRALEAETRTRRRDEAVRAGSDEVHRLLGRLLASRPTPAQVDLLQELADRCDELVRSLADAPAPD